MTYRFLAISDVHMSNSLPHAKPGERGISDRLQDQIRLWEHVAESCREYKPNALLILGDLFDKAVTDPVTLTHTVESIVKLPVERRILPGNHDCENVIGGPKARFNVEVFRAMGRDGIHFFEHGQHWTPQEGINFYAVPYGPSEDAMGVVRKAHENIRHTPGEHHVLLLHHSIVGCSHLGWTCDDGLDSALVTDGFSLVLSGHFHEHQYFGDEMNGFYLGAPMHHHYGDVGRDAFYWLVDLKSDATANWTQIDPGLPKFHTANWGEPIPEPVGDYLRIIVEATHAEWATLKMDVQEVVRRLIAKGVRASYTHKPIYHHKERIEPAEKGKRSMEGYVRNYVKHANTDGLDAKSLRRMGVEILREAQSEL